MADTSAAVSYAGYWGSLAVLLGLGATWLQRRVTARWKAEDARTEAEAEAAKAARVALAPVTSADTELAAKRIELARAYLQIEDLTAALGRQRRSMDELEREVSQKSAAVTQERARSESLLSELTAVRRQIEGATHGPSDTRRSDRDSRSDRSRVRSLGDAGSVAREEAGPRGRKPDR